MGLEIIPYSITHQFEDGTKPEFTKSGTTKEEDIPLKTCTKLSPAVNDPSNFMLLNPEGGTEVLYTYDVDWISSDLVWSNRWDIYMTGNPDDEVHVFSLVNSLMIIFFLSGVVAMIMLKTLHKDISQYNEVNEPLCRRREYKPQLN